MTADLVAFLTARLDEEERIARAAEGDPVFDGTGIVIERNRARGFPDRIAGVISPVAIHIARHDPARVLAEVEAKRRIVEAYLPPEADPHPGLPCTDDVEGDPDGEFYAEQHPFDQGACVRHAEASKRLLRHDYVLRLLASVYADHHDYRPEWAPDPEEQQ